MRPPPRMRAPSRVHPMDMVGYLLLEDQSLGGYADFRVEQPDVVRFTVRLAAPGTVTLFVYQFSGRPPNQYRDIPTANYLRLSWPIGKGGDWWGFRLYVPDYIGWYLKPAGGETVVWGMHQLAPK
jgi:hypothetical protein